ncbi:MAG: hypothetical protein ACLQJ0_16870 [Steroidobacteraceae bacterium]|jgi:hypothetical protein
MCNLDLKNDERTAAAVAAESANRSACAIPKIAKTRVNPERALHLACEGDTLEQDDLEISAEALPLFDTHSSRHLG